MEKERERVRERERGKERKIAAAAVPGSTQRLWSPAVKSTVRTPSAASEQSGEGEVGGKGSGGGCESRTDEESGDG